MLQQHNKNYALLYFDIDNFKYINDPYGHAYSDQLLQHIAETLNNLLRQGEIYARFANDHFAIFLDYEEAQDVAQLVLEDHKKNLLD